MRKKIFLLIFFINGIIISQNIPSYAHRQQITMLSVKDKVEKTDSPLLTGEIEADSYILGPGDEFLVSISGVNEQQIQLVINPEGLVFISQSGLLALKGKTLNEGKDEIERKILSRYKDVKVNIMISKIRLINVFLSGNVKNPGNYSLPATARLTDLLRLSDGIYEDTDIRNIEIVLSNSDTTSCDLLSFYRLSDLQGNPSLFNNSKIIFKKTDKIVSILGSIFYPGDYELKENERIADLISIAGGITENARADSLELIRFESDKKTLKSYYYSLQDIFDDHFQLLSGDKVIIREIPEFKINRTVEVFGEVKFPGVYKIRKDGTSLYQLLTNEVGGFLERASLKDAYVLRSSKIVETDYEYERLKIVPRADMTDDEYDYFKARSRERKGRMVIDFEKLFFEKDQKEDIILKMGDKIFIPEAKDFVTLVGQVVSPGNIVYKADFKIDDYIRLAGGFAWRAVDDDIRVIKGASGEWIEYDEVENIEPGDIIWVPEEPPAPKFWEVFIDVLTVTGQMAAIITAITALVVASR